MNGRAHALSGAVGWTVACAGLSLLDRQPSWPTVLVGAAVAAGGALAPDIDHPGSTISRSLGPVTRGLARVVSFVADLVQDATCRCCKDPNRTAHRGLTHTAAGAVLAGVGAGALGWFVGPAGIGVLAFAFTWLAVRGMLPRRRRYRAAPWPAAVLAGLAAYAYVPGGEAWWAAIPVSLGVLAHIAGDGMTYSAVPALWPLRIRGCRWYRLGSPRWMRFRTGGLVERYVITTVLLASAAGAGWVLVA